MQIEVLNVEENKLEKWSLEDVLEEINRDRSEHWTDYDETDWQEGWREWVDGEFYSIDFGQFDNL